MLVGGAINRVMLEQKVENKVRDSLCSVLHNQRFQLNVKSFHGGKWSSGLHTFIVHSLPYF